MNSSKSSEFSSGQFTSVGNVIDIKEHQRLTNQGDENALKMAHNEEKASRGHGKSPDAATLLR